MAFEEYIAALGTGYPPTLETSKLDRMRGILLSIRRHPRFKPGLLYFHEAGGTRTETLKVSVDCSVGQRNKADIRTVETLMIQCREPELFFPKVSVLRDDFPVTPHQWATPPGEPRALCLYAEPYDEQMLVWNPTEFLQRIVEWLERTAAGTLHPDDQPPEPFFYGAYSRVIIPRNVPFGTDNLTGVWLTGRLIAPVIGGEIYEGHLILEVLREDQAQALRTQMPAKLLSFVVVETRPTPHGLIHEPPTTFGALRELLNTLGVDLLKAFRRHIARVRHSKAWSSDDLLGVAVRIPLLQNGETRSYSHAAFVFHKSIKDIGISLDVLDTKVTDPISGRLTLEVWEPVGDAPRQNRADGELLSYFSGILDLDSEAAAYQSGSATNLSAISIAMAGYGALGSSIFNLLHRSGIAKWVLVDNDVLLPHNLVRHDLARRHVGLNKAFAAIDRHGTLWPDSNIRFVPMSVKDTYHAAADRRAVEDSDVILDCTASQAATRFLTLDFTGKARRIACFTSPNGRDGVFLDEGKSRSISLDSVEAQYFRYLIRGSIGRTHMSLPKGTYRYGMACRDVAVMLSPEQVGMHSALMADEVKRALRGEAAQAAIWTVEEDALRRLKIPLAEERRTELGELTIVWDAAVEARMEELREQHLPKETGGALLGYFDAQRRIVYVVDALEAPPDSKSGRGHFIRGSEGLAERLKDIYTRTGGTVTMVGDWHSHPMGVSTNPSADDVALLVAEGHLMAQDDRPGLIAIMGDDGKPTFCLMCLLDTETA